MLYFAYTHQADDGYSGFFPSVEGCCFAGATFEEAVIDAYSALKAHFELLTAENIDLPLSKPVSAYLEDEDCTGGIWATVSIDVSIYNKRHSLN